MPLGPNVGQNIKELHQGPRYAANMKKFGKNKANKIAIAAAFSGAGEGRRRKSKISIPKKDKNGYY